MHPKQVEQNDGAYIAVNIHLVIAIMVPPIEITLIPMFVQAVLYGLYFATLCSLPATAFTR